MSPNALASSRRLSIEPSRFILSDDPDEALKEYLNLRQCIRDTFESFLRNLNLKALHSLEQHFERHDGELDSSTFLQVFDTVCPMPSLDRPDWRPTAAERKFIQQAACLTLFEFVDVDMSGAASWMEFVEFVCAIAEELRMKAAEESGQIFDFLPADQVATHYKPTAPKCHYDHIYYWPEHPTESVVVLEEGQPSFFLHRPKTLYRKKKVDGHRHDLLSATFLPAPFTCTVTSGNDNLVCFWDENYNLIKRWELDQTFTGEKGKSTSAGALCWCHEIRALFAADHFSEKVRAWRITDMMDIRSSESVMELDKRLSLSRQSNHTKAVQAICWMAPMKCLATASLDTTIHIFDLVEMKRVHILMGHKRGLTHLQYCEKNHILLSAGFDSYINIWDPGAGTLSFCLEGHDCSIAGLCRIPGTDFEFASVDFESVVRVWDVRRLSCSQTFCATDRQLEKNGELEPLVPRTICAISRGRLIVGGRRIVTFDRDASNPRATADWPINAVGFNERRLEIITPIKNDLYVWCALTGQMRSLHDNIIEGTITAIALGSGERRVFVGADDGEVVVVNYACGALLKKLERHDYEVNQITTMPEKVLTLSIPEKIIKVHDDNDPQRAAVLKRIDVSDAGHIMQFALDGRDILAGVSDDQRIVWYNTSFAKEVSNSDGCEVVHRAAVACVVYFEDAPLLATADAEGCVLFWSVPPLRTYSFFNKIHLDYGETDVPFSVSAMALSHPDQGYLYTGVERGHLACVDIRSIVDNAKAQQQDIIRRKECGQAADVISGRIFDKMPKPCDSPEYVFALPSRWIVHNAHRGSVDRILVCRRKTPVVITLGSDCCVRIWCHETGEALGTLEQGLPEGFDYQRGRWLFPLNPHEELEEDQNYIENAAAVSSDDSQGTENFDTASSESAPSRASRGSRKRETTAEDVEAAPLTNRSHPTSRDGQPSKGSTAGADEMRRDSSKGQALQSMTMKSSTSAPQLRSSKTTEKAPKPAKRTALGEKALAIRKEEEERRRRALKEAADEWYAGPHAQGYWSNKSGKAVALGSLPKLPSGLSRPSLSGSKDLVSAARRLACALNEVDPKKTKDYY